MKRYKLELTEDDLNSLAGLIAVVDDIAPEEQKVLDKIRKQIKSNG